MFSGKLRCSFCRRSNKDVAKLVAGPRVYICDRCAHEAVRIMETTPPGDISPGTRATLLKKRVSDWSRAWHFVAPAAHGQ